MNEFLALKLTTDNYFTSKSLASTLLEKRTTLVGTIQKNYQKIDNLPRFSSEIYKTDNCTLSLCKSKPTRKVLLLATKHNLVIIEKDKKKIPETIIFYNKTKFGDRYKGSNGQKV